MVIAALDVDNETFLVHEAIREREELPVDSKKQAQTRATLFNEALTEVPAEYSDYSKIFSAENSAELPENIEMNEHAIKLEKGKQPPFSPIYSLELIELKTLKTYIKTNLVNGFIRPSKSSAGVSILFDRKPDRSLRLCVNYRGLNYITIKNRYLLLLMGKSFDWLGWARKFTQLDLTNAYYWMRIREGDE